MFLFRKIYHLLIYISVEHENVQPGNDILVHYSSIVVKHTWLRALIPRQKNEYFDGQPGFSILCSSSETTVGLISVILGYGVSRNSYDGSTL